MDKSLIPRIIRDCVDYLEKKGLFTEGIFRVSGRTSDVLNIQKAYDDEVEFDIFQIKDPHVVASLLKKYFRDRKNTLFGNICRNFLDATEYEETKQCQIYSKLVLSLPPENRSSLHLIMGLLKKIDENSDINRMDATNLATMLAPGFLKPESDSLEIILHDTAKMADVIQILIENYGPIFEGTPFSDDNKKKKKQKEHQSESQNL